ncbi:GNAT family N-acetyltransferase [Anatilimnocola sp. NA78]|uniref:GNAT family N-acetyltransferase n=1 Tax=Anatilimnocola sp. NA78 TaxID=3415683 RepID=UPI003CE5A7E1
MQLVSIDLQLAETFRTSPAECESAMGATIGPAAEWLPNIFDHTLSLYERKPRPLQWGAFLAIDDTTNQIIGTCAYKEAPTAEGLIEIAYFTFPPFENRGHATTMATELTACALLSPEVNQVIAHTLPERNASCRALEKAGFRFVGDVIDQEDGPVWRWERTKADAYPEHSSA